ncbi:MAG: hypothetical protein ABSH49_29080 [Bryobacteraceae bacterium]|jgi:hypothetical protein
MNVQVCGKRAFGYLPGAAFLKLQGRLGGLGGTMSCNLAIAVCGIICGVTLARSLGPIGRGEMAAALLWPGVLVLLGDLGLGFAFSFYAGTQPEEIGTLWTLTVLIGSGVGAILATLGSFLLPILLSALTPTACAGMRIGLLSVPLILVSGYQAYLLLGAGWIADYNAVKLIASIAYAVSLPSLALCGARNVSSYAAAFVLSQTLGLLAAAGEGTILAG